MANTPRIVRAPGLCLLLARIGGRWCRWSIVGNGGRGQGRLGCGTAVDGRVEEAGGKGDQGVEREGARELAEAAPLFGTGKRLGGGGEALRHRRPRSLELALALITAGGEEGMEGSDVVFGGAVGHLGHVMVEGLEVLERESGRERIEARVQRRLEFDLVEREFPRGPLPPPVEDKVDIEVGSPARHRDGGDGS